MNFKQMTSLSVLAAASLLSFGAQAVVVTQWNFNASNLVASAGVNTTFSEAASVGATTTAYAAGSEAGTNFAWNTAGYANQSTGDNTKGVQFKISTLGFENIVFSYASQHSNTASANERVQYSVDGGASFVDLQTFTTVNGASPAFINRSVDLSTISATDNIGDLRVRIVSTFAGTTGAYAASKAGSNYAGTGTMRFDMVTFNGDAVAAVPEPSTYAMLLAGLGAVGFVARRRKQA